MAAPTRGPSGLAIRVTTIGGRPRASVGVSWRDAVAKLAGVGLIVVGVVTLNLSGAH